MANDKATLTVGTESWEFPVRQGTLGPDVVDIGSLYGQTGRFTYDPGFTSTASCVSDITFIDGGKGMLLHRGYSIEDLAEHGDFLETCFLLLYGYLPNQQESDDFHNRVTYHTMVHEQMNRFFTGFRRDAHPMAIMCGVVGALSAFYHDSTDISDPHVRMVASLRMISKCRHSLRWRINIISASLLCIHAMIWITRQISFTCASAYRVRITW